MDIPDIFDRLEALINLQSSDDKSIQQNLAGTGAPIISVGVLEDGNITAKILGSPQPKEPFATIATATQFDKDTLFQACSISKPITALAVMKLCQEGTLDLDAPISQYLSHEQLSWISAAKTLPLVSQISLRLLISHTAGLSCHGFDGYAKSDIPTLQQTLQGEPPANNEPVILTLLPGQKFAYSGGGFQVTQLILEIQLQKPFHQIMEEVILKPLGMNRSTYRFLPPGENNYAPAYLTGKNMSDPDHHSMVESAAAGLWTTPSDLLKAIHAVQKSLQSGDLLEKEWAEKMLLEVEDNGMALGWAAKKKRNYFGHAGDNSPGYACYLAGFKSFGERSDYKERENEEDAPGKLSASIPNESGVSVMTSSALGHPVIGRILAAISYLKGWPSLYHHKVIPFMDREKVIDERAKEWCGHWGSGKWGIVDEGGLLVRCGDFPSVPLVSGAIPPYTYDEGNSIDLVADGLETMLRLGWKDGLRIVEIWQDGEDVTLERKE